MVSTIEMYAKAGGKAPWEGDREGGVLLQETHHRVMNTLTILAGQLRRELRAPVQKAECAISGWERLIKAHGALHGFLARGATGDPEPIGEYVIELCRRLSEAILEPLGLRCEAVTDAGLVPAKRCERLGLIICELVLNAAKHAFPHHQPGLVRVELMKTPAGWLCTVSDNGRGCQAMPGSTGLGGKIVEDLLQTVDGSMVIRSSAAGTSVTILLTAA